MAICIGTTTAPYKATDQEDIDWLTSVGDLIRTTQAAGVEELYFFAALEIDERGVDVYNILRRSLEYVDNDFGPNVHADFWTFSLDDGAEEIDGFNRLIRICTGRNLIQEFALRNKDISHILFLDSDLVVPPDCIVKLLEVGKHLVGGDVPSYCLHGPVAEEFDFPVETHWNTAGFLMADREIFRRVKWRIDLHDAGLTDDPCFANDVNDLGLGPTFVRKDLIGLHRGLVSMEERGHDRAIRRANA